jgi:large subunit ribosomal protein L33
MADAKRKAATLLIKLVSGAGTGYFYVKKKNPRTIPHKLQFMKYDPRVRRHVLFTEQKLK